uniref:Uncharacterized protein n=1 Tax=Ignavibacterium album TaxID=591197 RepID=A0A832G6D8_9BACT
MITKKRTEELNKILGDNRSGSLEILLKLKKHFLKYSSDKEHLLNSVRNAEVKLKQFPAIRSFLKELKNELKKSNHIQLTKFLELSISEQEYLILNLFERHKSTLLKYQKITTISFSRTLNEIFKLCYKENPKLEIFVLESRPMYEGRNFVKELIKHRIKCHLTVDAMMNFAVQNSDCVIIGADQILMNGNVVNKIGSYPLALCAKAAKKPFYVLATKDKFINSNKFIPDNYPSQEICDFKNPYLRITNQYFEVIPKELITKTLI